MRPSNADATLARGGFAVLTLFAALASCAATNSRGRAMPDLPGQSVTAVCSFGGGGPQGGDFGSGQYHVSADCAADRVEIRGTEWAPGQQVEYEQWKACGETDYRPVAICTANAGRFYVFGDHADGPLRLRTQGGWKLEHASRLVLEEWALDTGEGGYHSAEPTSIAAIGTPSAKHTPELLLREPYAPPEDRNPPVIERRPLVVPETWRSIRACIADPDGRFLLVLAGVRGDDSTLWRYDLADETAALLADSESQPALIVASRFLYLGGDGPGRTVRVLTETHHSLLLFDADNDGLFEDALLLDSDQYDERASVLAPAN